MGLAFSRRTLTTLTVTIVFAGVVACAKGENADLGPAVAATVEPTEPAPPSQKLPATNPPEGEGEGEGEEDSGSSSGGTSSGGSSSGGVDGGGTDAGADAAIGVDAGKDAGGIDAGPVCAKVAPSNVCGLAPQCGCAINQTCDVTTPATGAVSCVLAGGGTLGSYCTSTTQCAKGFTCGYNACRPHCATVGASCAAAGAGLGQCTQVYDAASGTPVTNNKVCTVACDPRSPSAACGSNNCIFDTGINATDCDKSGTKTLYAACTRYNDCQQGLACADHPLYGYECEKWCRIGQSDCAAFETCEDVYGATAPSSGGAKLGHCQ